MATPTEHAWREFAVFLRGPAGFNTYNFTSSSNPNAGYRAGALHDARISAIPVPQDTSPDTFGIVANPTFTLEIADERTDDDWPLLDSNGDFLFADDGSGRLIQDY